jgi:hypothetical protein
MALGQARRTFAAVFGKLPVFGGIFQVVMLPGIFPQRQPLAGEALTLIIWSRKEQG